ncbi:MAG: sulfite exporter TauE/SafE family protein [Rhodospirillales bacterium]
MIDEPAFFHAQLAPVLAACRATIETQGGLLTSLFVAGLVGSVTHCAGMCGPFVVTQTIARLDAVPAAGMSEFHRLAGAALVPYHLGRATTYAVLGALVAALTGGFVQLTQWRWLSAALLALAALFFLAYACRGFGLALPGVTGVDGSGWWSRRIEPWAKPLFARPIGWRGYGLGVVLGFLPCGLLYGAIAAAASAGGAVSGALAMLAFSLGTVPMLIAVGIAGHVAGSHFRGPARTLAPVLMLVNAVALSYLAWRLAAA